LSNNIKVYENFVSAQEIDFLLSFFIDYSDNFELINNSVNLLGFGQDNFPASSLFNNPNSFSDILPQEKIKFIQDYYKRVETTVGSDIAKDISMSALWFVKTMEGGFPEHGDNEPDAIYQYEQTCILYLNDCENGGEIVLPEFDYSFLPKAGSLLSFPANYVHAVLPVSHPRYTMPSWLTENKAYSLDNYV
jgi:hypothetical protein